MKDPAEIIKKKSILICGGTPDQREHALGRVRKGWKGRGKSDVFTLKKGIKDADDFIEAVRKSFPVTSPLKGVTKDMMGFNQINDYFLEWPHELAYDSCLIIIPDFHKLAESDPEYFFGKLDHFFNYANMYQHAGCCDMRIVMTFQKPIPELASRINLRPYHPPYLPQTPGGRFLTTGEMIEVMDLG